MSLTDMQTNAQDEPISLLGEVGRIASASVELRGIVPLAGFVKECRAFHPEIETDDDAVQLVFEAAAAAPLYVVLVTKGDTFLLDPDLAEAYLQEHDDVRVLQEEARVEGPLDDFLDSLLYTQEDKPARPVDAAMLQSPHVALWRQQLPAAVALRDWLEANAPSGSDDQDFADRVMMEFGFEVKWGDVSDATLPRYIDILVDNVMALDDARTQAFLGLLVDYVNTQPIWPNNGWSPAELAAGLPA